MKKLLVILGPTATGKTDLGLNLAKKFNGELISCDSRQVYRGLDIGTGKLPGFEVGVKKGEGFWEMDKVRIWMLDVASPTQQYDVAQYIRDANLVIKKKVKANKLPIIVGGTGLYLKGLIDGLANLNIPIDLELREKLADLSLAELSQKLSSLSKKAWDGLNASDRKNPRRLIRHIERVLLKPAINVRRLPGLKDQGFDLLKIGLKGPRAIIYQRIDQRVVKRVKEGLIAEGESLLKQGLSIERMKSLGLEYGVLADYLTGRLDKANFTKVLQTKIHQYAKRQLTWFKKEDETVWFDVSQKDFLKKVENYVDKWYD